MNTKPINPTTHVALDYGFAGAILLAPTILNLKGPAKKLCYLFGATTGIINALTDNQLGLKRLISIHRHGQLETPLVPALLAVPLAAGVFKEKKGRNFFLAYFGAVLINYLLTDYEDEERLELGHS